MSDQSLKMDDGGGRLVRLLVRQSSSELTSLLRKILPRSLFQLEVVEKGIDVAARMAEGTFDAVLLDLSSPSMENRRSFDAVMSLPVPIPIIVYGQRGAVENMSSFIRHGAYGMFCVEDDADIIIHTVRQASHSYRLSVENESLREALARKRRAVGILENLSEAMSTVFDVRKILNLTLRVVRRALDCEVCRLYLVDSESGELMDSRDLGFEGDDPQLELWRAGIKSRRKLLHGAATRALAGGEPLHLSSAGEINSIVEGEEPPDEGGLRNILAAPLTFKSRKLGILLAANRIGTAGFMDEDMEILRSVARQTASAIAGVRSLKMKGSFKDSLGEQLQLTTGKLKERNLELRMRLAEKEEANRKIKSMAKEIADKNRSLNVMIDQFKVIHEISQVIGSELESETLIKRIITETSTLLSGEIVSLMLKNGGGNLRIRHAVGLSSEVIRHTLVKPGEGISGWVSEEGKPILVKDVSSIKKETGEEQTRYRGNSLLCVPLKIKGKVSGVLNVTNRTGGGSFDEKDLFLLTILGNHAAIAIENSRLYEAIRENYFNTIKALVNAVEAKDSWTKDHSENVTNYSLKIADYLGLSDKQKDIIRYAGVLHDIGKIVISSTITDKPDKLTEDEWEKIREHPLIGQRILDPIDFLEPVKVCIQTHHERCDGSGYPFGLRAHEIPLETRILSVADAFDAMVHSRPYRNALSVNDAIAELQSSSGSQFDPAVVEGLVRIIEAEGVSKGPEQ